MTALAKLPGKWREEAGYAEINALEADSIGLHDAAKSSDRRAKLLAECADELEAALSPVELGGVEEGVEAIQRLLDCAELAVGFRGFQADDDNEVVVLRDAIREAKPHIVSLSTPRAAQAVFYDIPGSGGTMHFQGDKPAQAGAVVLVPRKHGPALPLRGKLVRDGGETWGHVEPEATPASPATGADNCPRDCGCIVHCRREQIVAAGYAERDGGQHAGRETRDVGDVQMARHWIDRYASGIDDEPQMDLIASALAAAPHPHDHIADADKMATPPAHGDGEGDDPFGDMPAPIGNPEAWPPNYADGYNDAVRNMVDSFPSVRARLTTHPTPEAQEARDAVDARRYRYLRDHCKREWYSDMPHNKGAPSLDIEFEARGHDLDAAIDAALALPAQGEGNNG